MKLLFLSQLLPFPLDAGPKTRAYYVLRQLASTHEVTLVCFSRRSDVSAAIDHLAGLGVAVHAVRLERPRWREPLALAQALQGGLPASICRDHRLGMAKLVKRVSTEQVFQSVHVDQIAMAQYGLLARVERRVLDAHNAMWHLLRRVGEMEHAAWRRALLYRESRCMRAYEALISHRVDALVAVSLEDRERLVEAGAPASVEVVPICIEIGPEPARGPISSTELVFIGGMHWPPNRAGIQWFARQVWPRVLCVQPAARLNVIGRDPPPELRADPSITVTGFLADPEPVLARSAAMVVPLQSGGGMRVKILEAWARGLPVVTTTVGREGLAGRAGQELLVADDAESFAAAVLELLDRPERRAALACAGRRVVAEQYDWRVRYRRFSELHGAEVGLLR